MQEIKRGVFEEHDATKRRWSAYRDSARRMAKRMNEQLGIETMMRENVAVQETEDGAFIEIILWVPKEQQ